MIGHDADSAPDAHGQPADAVPGVAAEPRLVWEPPIPKEIP